MTSHGRAQLPFKDRKINVRFGLVSPISTQSWLPLGVERIGLFHNCLEVGIKRTKALNSGCSEKEKLGRMRIHGIWLGDPHFVPLCGRRADGGRVKGRAISSCSKNCEWAGIKSLSGQVNTG